MNSEVHSGVKRLWILLFLTFGCTRIPFKEAPCVPMSRVSPLTVRENYKDKFPDTIRVLNSVVFEYKGKVFTGIGLLSVNSKEKKFAVICLNPMGLKIFEITGDKNSVHGQFVMEQLSEKGNLAGAVGEDIKRIYFDLIPSPDAENTKDLCNIVFTQLQGTKRTDYIYSGVGPYLTHKKYFDNNNLLWEVSYYEYQENHGNIYPRGIILNNVQYKYRLIITLKEILPDEPD